MWLLAAGIAGLHWWLWSHETSTAKHNFQRDGLKTLTDDSFNNDAITFKCESGAVPAATKTIKNR